LSEALLWLRGEEIAHVKESVGLHLLSDLSQLAELIPNNKKCSNGRGRGFARKAVMNRHDEHSEVA